MLILAKVKNLLYPVILQLILGTSTLMLVAQEQYPSTQLVNEQVKMKVYLPNKDDGFYRATRFDLSGVIASLKYHSH